MLYQVLNTHRGDCAEKQQHNSSQHSRWNALQECTQFAYDREDNGRGGSYADDLRMSYLSNTHGSRHLTISCYRRTAEDASSQTCQSIAQHGAMKSRFFHKILVSHSSHYINIANMLNDWCDSDRYHIEKRFPSKLRQMEIRQCRRQSNPRSSCHL